MRVFFFVEVKMALRKRGSIYYAIIRVDGKQHWIRVGSDYREARRQHDILVAEACKGSLAPVSQVGFSEFADEWLRTYCEVRLKPSTYYEYEIHVRCHLKPYFGDMRMDSITTKTVQNYIADKVKQGRWDPKTIRNQMVTAKRLFACAVDWGVITHNPAARVVLPRIPHREMSFLEPSEMRRLIEATPEGCSRLLIATACLTGARKGEIQAMRHKCWDLEARTITIRQTLYAGKLQDPKSKRSIRVLPMPDTLAEMYLSLTAGGVDPDSFIFHQPDGTPLANGTPNRILARAIKKAGLPEVTFHALRHSFVAAAIASDVPLKVIQALAGHASITTTMDRYGHLLPNSQADAAKAVSEAIYGAESQDMT